MSGRSPWRRDYVPYLLDFPHISPCYPYRCAYCQDEGSCQLSCAEELERVIKQEGSDSISAFIAEPVSGTSLPGSVPPLEYFQKIRAICDKCACRSSLLCLRKSLTMLLPLLRLQTTCA